MFPAARRIVEFRIAKIPPQVGSVGQAEPLPWMACGPPPMRNMVWSPIWIPLLPCPWMVVKSAGFDVPIATLLESTATIPTPPALF